MGTIAGSTSPEKNKLHRKDANCSEPSEADLHSQSKLSPEFQSDYLKLLWSQERRVESLKRDNRELTSERDLLQRRCAAQLEVIDALKAGRNVVRMPVSSSNDGARKRSIQLEDMPEFDAAEFQPIDDAPYVSILEKLSRPILNSFKSLSAALKLSGVWMAKKIFAILT